MQPIKNIAEVKEAGDSVKLPAGGYVCQYINVNDVPEKSYLYMEYDIAEGDFAGYYKALSERADFWGGRCYRSYSDKALPMFKRMCSAVTKSNKKFIFDGNKYCDESTLIGKLVGLILGEEEYIGNDGSKKTRLYVVREVPVDDIRAGKYKVPEIKKLKDDTSETSNKPGEAFSVPEGNDDEVPFG